MGNNTQASYTAILTTKSNGSQVGNTSTQTAIVSLPNYSISIGTITSSDDNADNYIRSGSTHKVSDFTSANTYLQGFSNPRLSFTLGSSSGYLYGNTINISGDASASGLMLGNNSVALGTNFTGGSKTLMASDGRKTTSGSITLTRKDWSVPSVSIKLERQSATGQTIDYEITYNFTSVSGGLTPKLSASYTYNGTTYTIYSEQALSNTSGTLSGTITLANADDYKYSISAYTTLTDTIDYQVQGTIQIPGGKPAIYTHKDSSANNKVDIYGDLGVEDNLNVSGNVSGNQLNTGNLSLSGKTSLLNLIYPIGSIYMSVNDISPQSFLGGTWERLQDRFLIGAGNSYNVNATGGSTTHTLTIDEIPSHTHTINDRLVVWDQPNLTALNTASYSGPFKLRDWHTGITDSTGGGQAHSIMNPYLAVYMWKRTN